MIQIILTFHVSKVVVRNLKMASCLSLSSRSDLPELPSSPHQPSSFTFPKRCFGNKVIVQRSCQRSWFERWPFLHYDEGKDVVYCHTCVTGFRQGKMKSSKAEPAFVSFFLYSVYTIFLIGRLSTICVRFYLYTECIRIGHERIL